MKTAELDRCLRGKLRLQRHDGTRHVDYRLVCAGDIVALPTLLRVSHGNGEVAGNNLGGVAKALGLNEHSAKHMVGCRIGRWCVLLCISARLLEFAKTRYVEEGEVFRPGLLAMLESVSAVTSDEGAVDPSRWTSEERKALERAHSIAEQLAGDPHVGTLAQALARRMVSPHGDIT